VTTEEGEALTVIETTACALAAPQTHKPLLPNLLFNQINNQTKRADAASSG
jgi:hypothetical protein